MARIILASLVLATLYLLFSWMPGLMTIVILAIAFGAVFAVWDEKARERQYREDMED